MSDTTRKKPSGRLKPRHASFLKAYISNGRNGTAAAISAGYSERSAADSASRLLKHPDVAAQLSRLAGQTEKKLELTAERVMQELATIALFDPATMYGEDGELLPVAQMPEATRRAIAGIEEHISPKGDRNKKLRISSKLGSLELVSKIIGMVKAQDTFAPVQIIIGAAPELAPAVERQPILPVWE
jgi:phage terminase small subunit